LLVGTVARLRAEKGLDLLLETFALVAKSREVRLVVVGDGPEEEALRAKSRGLGIDGRVVFAGPFADARDAYRALDLFVLTSRTEQMPIALLEAMGCGLAVVASDVGDVGAMVAAESRAFVVAVRDARLFAPKIVELLQDEALRRRLGAANRARALAEYRLETMVARHRALWDEVARNGGGAPRGFAGAG
jgi:glycosyltransferase involved in cell wall biosynthesis